MKLEYIIFTLFICNVQLSAQSFLKVDTAVYIEWEEERPLSWADYVYKKSAKKRKGSLALTTVFHSVRGSIKNDHPHFEVRVLYDKTKSWTTDPRDPILLNHEKLHFDLAELYGRKIRKQIDILGKRGESQLKKYRADIRTLLDEFKRQSIAYDKETGHGRFSDAQQKWNDFVFSEMKRLKSYQFKKDE